MRAVFYPQTHLPELTPIGTAVQLYQHCSRPTTGCHSSLSSSANPKQLLPAAHVHITIPAAINHVSTRSEYCSFANRPIYSASCTIATTTPLALSRLMTQFNWAHGLCRQSPCNFTLDRLTQVHNLNLSNNALSAIPHPTLLKNGHRHMLASSNHLTSSKHSTIAAVSLHSWRLISKADGKLAQWKTAVYGPGAISRTTRKDAAIAEA